MGNNIDHATRLEEILAEWDLDNTSDPINMSSIGLPSANDTITITASQTSPYTFTGALGASFSNTVYTTSGVGVGGNVPWMTSTLGQVSAPKIQLDGEGADVTVNGWSLVAAVKRIEERLGLFQPNPELETEWEELKVLGDQYRKLEQHIRDKQATWDKLKAMPEVNLE
jgi:hypothetical protein